MSWIIALFAGAVGGFIGGIALSKYSMGTAYNMIAGLVGGGIGGLAVGQLDRRAALGRHHSRCRCRGAGDGRCRCFEDVDGQIICLPVR